MSLSHVWLFAAPLTVACLAPLSVEILHARILESVATHSSRGSSQIRDWTQVSRIAGRFFIIWATREAKEWCVSSLPLLQGNLPTQELNQGLLNCKQILYQLSYSLVISQNANKWWKYEHDSNHKRHRKKEKSKIENSLFSMKSEKYYLRSSNIEII